MSDRTWTVLYTIAALLGIFMAGVDAARGHAGWVVWHLVWATVNGAFALAGSGEVNTR